MQMLDLVEMGPQKSKHTLSSMVLTGRMLDKEKLLTNHKLNQKFQMKTSITLKRKNHLMWQAKRVVAEKLI